MKYTITFAMLIFCCKTFCQVDTTKYLTNTFSKTTNKFIGKTFGYFDSTIKAKIKKIDAGSLDMLLRDASINDTFYIKNATIFFDDFSDLINYVKHQHKPILKLTFKHPILVTRGDLEYLLFKYSSQTKLILKNSIIAKIEIW